MSIRTPMQRKNSCLSSISSKHYFILRRIGVAGEIHVSLVCITCTNIDRLHRYRDLDGIDCN